MKETGKIQTNKLVDYTELLTDEYVNNTTSKDRKSKGQFFTPKTISEFMVRQYNNLHNKDEIKILDPGAGIGIFESTICDMLISKSKRPKVIFEIYENDENILPYLKKNMRMCKKKMEENGFKFFYRIYSDDFIIRNSSFFKRGPVEIRPECFYDYAISNPPYYKIRKSSRSAKDLEIILKGQPNIYILFMALSAKLLKENGELVVITPRSYCSGPYFINFRRWFFNYMKPKKIHVFGSRRDVFKKYHVLQEMVILAAVKRKNDPKYLTISNSKGDILKTEKIKKRKTEYAKSIIKMDNDIIMRIPTTEEDELLADKVDSQGNKLDSLGFKVSTGPVVPFRTSDSLVNSIADKNKYAPLIWMQNIQRGKVGWPLGESKRPMAIKKDDITKKILIPNKNYVLIKRFSAKEGRKRINAGVLLKKWINSDQIGIENHVNYIYRPNGNLSEDEAYGITAILNSKVYDRYFQIINGSTQVNATEIMNFPFPDVEKIRLMGKLIRENQDSNEINNEKIIVELLGF